MGEVRQVGKEELPELYRLGVPRDFGQYDVFRHGDVVMAVQTDFPEQGYAFLFDAVQFGEDGKVDGRRPVRDLDSLADAFAALCGSYFVWILFESDLGKIFSGTVDATRLHVSQFRSDFARSKFMGRAGMDKKVRFSTNDDEDSSNSGISDYVMAQPEIGGDIPWEEQVIVYLAKGGNIGPIEKYIRSQLNRIRRSRLQKVGDSYFMNWRRKRGNSVDEIIQELGKKVDARLEAVFGENAS